MDTDTDLDLILNITIQSVDPGTLDFGQNDKFCNGSILRGEVFQRDVSYHAIPLLRRRQLVEKEKITNQILVYINGSDAVVQCLPSTKR
jgi:hypothetical protein